MGNFLKKIIRLLGEYWAKVDINHKLTLIFLGTLFIVVSLSVIYYSSKPAYSPLYYGLDQDSAAAIKEYLDDQKVPYKIQDMGKSILVPSDKVYNLRLSLASKGIPKKGQAVGYEIFDKANLGVTDFVQKINYYRAVQGELSRTISTIDGVESARVHIVIPEESIFKEDEREPTASIVLQLRAQGILDTAQIAGIRQLISASVEGLKSSSISIIDNWGNVLSQPSSGEDTVGDQATNQIGIQKTVENHYAKKIESFLTSVLGNNNAVVRINALMNFDRVEKTSETYNPESAVVRQETITSEKSSGKTAGAEGAPGVQANTRTTETAAAGAKQENSNNREVVSNVYEIDKTVQRIVQGVGSITRLTASVFIRQKTQKDDKGVLQPVARTAEEMTVFEDIVKNAIGFNQERGDTVSVKEIAFSAPEIPDAAKAMAGAAKKDFIVNLVKSLLAGVAAIILVFFAITFFKKVKVEEVAGVPEAAPGMEMRPGAERSAAAAAEGMGVSEAALQQVAKGAFVESEVAALMERQPEEATLIVKKWMGQK
jgi:flagellar M-ring protein FliF